MSTDNQPLVTIGVLAYNRPKMLAKALDCIVGQSYRNLEIIISDDCSPNEQVAVVAESYRERDSRIRFFRQPVNLDAIKNHWFLLDQANGKYFMWAYDDDLYEESMVEIMVAAMEANDSAVLCACDVNLIDDDDKIIRIERLSSLRGSQSWKKTRQLFFAYPTSNIYLACLGLYRTELMRRHGIRQDLSCRGYNTNMEVPFLARASLAGEIIHVDAALLSYRTHEDSRYIKEIAKINLRDRILMRWCIRSKLFGLVFAVKITFWERICLLNKIVLSWVMSIVRGLAAMLLPNALKQVIKRALKKRARV